jgi:hypothetical protein
MAGGPARGKGCTLIEVCGSPAFFLTASSSYDGPADTKAIAGWCDALSQWLDMDFGLV